MTLWFHLQLLFASFSNLPKAFIEEPLMEKKNLIGKGGSGTVHKVCLNGHDFAMKSVSVSSIGHIGMPIEVQNELSTLEMLKHPNIIKLSSYWEIKYKDAEGNASPRVMCYNYLLELMDLDSMDYLDLSRYSGSHLEIYQKRESDLRKLYIDITNAIAYIHSKGVSHLDIKPENILVKTKGGITTFKLADFGLSTTKKRVGLGGTTLYTPPEMYSLFVEYKLLDYILTTVGPDAIPLNLRKFEFRLKPGDKVPVSGYFKEIFRNYESMNFDTFRAWLSKEKENIENRRKTIELTQFDAVKVDIFEFGKSLYEFVLNWDGPFQLINGQCFTEEQQIDKSELHLAQPDPNNPKFEHNNEFQYVVRKMMHCNSDKRPSAIKLLTDEFIF